MAAESVWSRAWQDTEHFRESAKSYWFMEVVGAAMFGVGGGFVGYWQTPVVATSLQQFAYPTVGGAMGIILGFVIVFAFIFAWNLFRAPYRQRNEARAKVIKCKEEYDELKQSIEEQQNVLVLTLDTYEFGLSSYRRYPNKPERADWLRLKVFVNPIDKPIDTLDLVIDGKPPIPANQWHGKIVPVFFIVEFNVTEWRNKGKNQIELKAYVGGKPYSSGRETINFDAEVFVINQFQQGSQ